MTYWTFRIRFRNRDRKFVFESIQESEPVYDGWDYEYKSYRCKMEISYTKKDNRELGEGPKRTSVIHLTPFVNAEGRRLELNEGESIPPDLCEADLLTLVFAMPALPLRNASCANAVADGTDAEKDRCKEAERLAREDAKRIAIDFLSKNHKPICGNPDGQPGL